MPMHTASGATVPISVELLQDLRLDLLMAAERILNPEAYDAVDQRAAAAILERDYQRVLAVVSYDRD